MKRKMDDAYFYFLGLMFFVISPLYTFFLVKGKKTSSADKAYIYIVATLFTLFFGGIASGAYWITLLAASILILAEWLAAKKVPRSH